MRERQRGSIQDYEMHLELYIEYETVCLSRFPAHVSIPKASIYRSARNPTVRRLILGYRRLNL